MACMTTFTATRVRTMYRILFALVLIVAYAYVSNQDYEDAMAAQEIQK